MKRSIRVDNLHSFTYHETEPGFVFPGMSHTSPELLYVDQGSLHSVAEGRDMILSQGDLVLYDAGQWHMQYADMGASARFLRLIFDVEGADLSVLLGRKFTASQNVVFLLRQMLQEQELIDDYSPDFLLGLVELVLLSLLRQSDCQNHRAKPTYALHSENEVIRRAQQFVTAHICEKLSVPLVARNVDVSPSYLTALFQKHLSISPGEYIRRVKLQESKQLIRQGNLNFTEIAAALNYSTVHHFSRQFKEKFGITPTEYAKSVK